MTRIRSAAVALALGAGVALGACKASTDLGVMCRMTAPCSSGTGTCVVSPEKVQNEKIDYIALGSAECDDLVCIRTAGSANPANDTGEARGYCTKSCIDHTDCSPDYQGDNNKLVCERLVLDQAFLDQYKQEHPDEYENAFGSGASARYCILPSSVAR
jgi:hypothetical protein